MLLQAWSFTTSPGCCQVCHLDSVVWCREVARLAIGSLSLEPYLERQNSDNLHVIGQQSDKEKEIKLAAALGYAAHVTHHLAQYLGVPLKYPIKPSNSHSVIMTAAQPIVTAPYGRCVRTAHATALIMCSFMKTTEAMLSQSKTILGSCET